jgi:hypothetical protein
VQHLTASSELARYLMVSIISKIFFTAALTDAISTFAVCNRLHSVAAAVYKFIREIMRSQTCQTVTYRAFILDNL